MTKAQQQQTREYRAKVASDCQGIARNLSYSGATTEAAAKHVLLEASHALDGAAVKVVEGPRGLQIVNARGAYRIMTWRERIAYWALGGATEIRP